MSWQAMIWAHKVCAGLSATEYRCLMVLAEHARDDGSDARPCVATIAREGEMGERTVQRSLRALEDAALIRVQARATTSKPTVWRLAVDLVITAKVAGRGANLVEARRARLAEERRQAGEDGVPDGADRPASLAPKPSPEPIQEEPVQEPTRERARNPLVPETAHDPVSRVVARWNDIAAIWNLSQITVMSPIRVKHTRARLAEHGLTGVLAAIDAVSASDFCHGSNDRGWRADFDFVVQPKSCTRLREGFYANRDRAPGAGGSKYAGMQAAFDQVLGRSPPHAGDVIDGSLA